MNYLRLAMNVPPHVTSIVALPLVIASTLTPAIGSPELRAAQPDAASPTRTATFVCDDKSTLTIQFISSGSTNQAHVMWGAAAWTLPQVRTGSGARFAADGVSVWNKGNDVLFERGSAKLNCTVAGSELVGSNWRLVEFQSSDDKIGIVKPDDPAKYTLALGADGRAAMRLNCNRGTGPWSSHASSADSGSFSLGPLAVTRALCPPPSLDERIAGDAQVHPLLCPARRPSLSESDG